MNQAYDYNQTVDELTNQDVVRLHPKFEGIRHKIVQNKKQLRTFVKKREAKMQKRESTQRLPVKTLSIKSLAKKESKLGMNKRPSLICNLSFEDNHKPKMEKAQKV